MPTKAYGRILFWEGASLWLLSAPAGTRFPRTEVHAHHAIQVTVALTGTVTIESGGQDLSAEVLGVAPDEDHAFEGTGLVAHLFVAPDGQAGRQILRARFDGGRVVALPHELVADLAARLRSCLATPAPAEADLLALGRELVTRLTGERPRLAVADPRIQRLLAWVEARCQDEVTLEEAAAFIRLSPGRARHLFVAEVGLPFKTYLTWLRLSRALEAFARGQSLTGAAHEAGFADSAHLSRTFRRMFGIAASSLRLT